MLSEYSSTRHAGFRGIHEHVHPAALGSQFLHTQDTQLLSCPRQVLNFHTCKQQYLFLSIYTVFQETAPWSVLICSPREVPKPQSQCWFSVRTQLYATLGTFRVFVQILRMPWSTQHIVPHSTSDIHGPVSTRNINDVRSSAVFES
jgi:hypothetical protein